MAVPQQVLELVERFDRNREAYRSNGWPPLGPPTTRPSASARSTGWPMNYCTD